MAGNPADLTTYKDVNNAHDHSYFGNGCTNGWNSGSKTPCQASDAGGRYIATADGETQKNGTYMNYQATTAGSGASIKTENSNTPDTFCPLGWQLPYSGTDGDYYDQSKSWNYIFTTYNIAFELGTPDDALKVKSYPFSHVYSGIYSWGDGLLYRQKTGGAYLWSSTIIGGTTAYGLITDVAVVRPAFSYIKTIGFPVRCVLGISNLEKLSMASA